MDTDADRDADLATVAGLIGDPTRARVLTTLGDGRALAASVLAAESGVAPSTVSGHLRRLVDGGLLTVRTEGRHRYYQLAGPEIAEVIEALARIAPPAPVRSLKEGTKAHAVRRARSCYDHLAGRLGVGVMGALIERGAIVGHDGRHLGAAATQPLVAGTTGSSPPVAGTTGSSPPVAGTTGSSPPVAGTTGSSPPVAGTTGSSPLVAGTTGSSDRLSAPGHDVDYILGEGAGVVFGEIGVDLPAMIAAPRRRALLRYCVDWSEQSHHLAGGLGAAVLDAMLGAGWVRRARASRALHVTLDGERALRDRFGLVLAD